MNRWLGQLHTQHVHSRRVRRLAELIAPLLPANGHVIDIGCGDGVLASLLQTPTRKLTGYDVLVRGETAVPVAEFDGRQIPLPDSAADAAMLIDVLHHADDAPSLLAEAARVAPRGIIIKDHLVQGLLATSTLRFMDRVGNARHGVALPYHYLLPSEWQALFEKLGLVERFRTERLGLYAFPAGLWFDRGLHVLVKLERR